MIKNFLPKIDPTKLCNAMDLCTIRKKENKDYCGVKKLDGSQYEIPLEEVVWADSYEGKPIVRTYSSGCVFINEDLNKVFLVTVSKKSNIQHQFTGWSPIEENLQDIYIEDKWIIKLRIDKIEDNAILRTWRRTWVEATELYNDIPLVDRALMENQDDDGLIFWRLVLLMHFVVKKYHGVLNYIPVEQVIDWKRYPIDTLDQQTHLAPNVSLIVHKALEVIQDHKS